MNNDLNPADQQLVDAWLASGLNRAAFARQQGLAYQHLLAAIRRVERYLPTADESLRGVELLEILPARCGQGAAGHRSAVAEAPVRVDVAAASARRTEAPALVLRWGNGVELTVDARTAERVARSLLTGGWPC
jgi:hypothetical protein